MRGEESRGYTSIYGNSTVQTPHLGQYCHREPLPPCFLHMELYINDQELQEAHRGDPEAQPNPDGDVVDDGGEVKQAAESSLVVDAS